MTTATTDTFMEYPKIETLFDRDPSNMKHVVPGKWRRDEFALVDRWLITEKIDGTNVRVFLDWADGEPVVRFGGRTDAAQMPLPLLDHLIATFPAEKTASAFDEGTTAIIFGEGYGPKIQKGGGLYRATPSFRVFDVAVIGNRTWWLNWDDVADVAAKLEVATVPVVMGGATTDEAISLVSLPSIVAHEDGGDGCTHEGIVARTDPLLLMRDGSRLVWKLKGRDFS